MVEMESDPKKRETSESLDLLNKSYNGRLRVLTIPESKPGFMFEMDLPSFVTSDIITIDASLLIEEALDLLRSTLKRYAVIRNITGSDKLSFYAYESVHLSELLNDSRSSSKPISEWIKNQVNLPNSTIALSKTMTYKSKPALKDTTVVIDGTKPLGVIVREKKNSSGSLKQNTMDRSDLLTNNGIKINTLGNIDHRIDMEMVSGSINYDENCLEELDELDDQDNSNDASNFNFHAEMPAPVETGKTVTLKVNIYPEKLPTPKNAIVTSEEITLFLNCEYKIVIINKQNFEIIGQESETFSLTSQNLKSFEFHLKGTNIGQGEIWVQCYQKKSCIATLVLKPEIVPANSIGSSTDIPNIQTRGLVQSDPIGYKQVENKIDIITIKNGTNKRYLYTVTLGDINRRFESEEFKSDILADINPLIAELDKAIVRTPEELESLMFDLKAKGNKLFKMLFPEQLQKIFRERVNSIDYLTLYSEDPFMPWELLYITEPDSRGIEKGKFLSELGLVRWVYINRAPRKIRIREKKAIIIAPKYNVRALKNVEKDCEILYELFDAQQVTPATRKNVLQILNTGNIDLLHFAGHGTGSNSNQSECSLELEPAINTSSTFRNLTPVLVEGCSTLKDKDGNRPIVVLNACCTDKGSYYLTGATGFAQAFIEREAGVFIGTQWSVEDNAASKFISVLYTELSNNKKMYEAIKSARKAIMKMNDATFLSYTVYADPFAEVVCEIKRTPDCI